MDFVDIYNNIKTRCGSPADVTSDVWKSHANAAYRYICSRYRFHATRITATFVTVSGSQRYDLPVDSQAIEHLWILPSIGTSRKLKRVGPEQKMRRIGSTEVGVPCEYYLESGFFELFPIPSAVFNMGIQYWYLPGDMVLDSDKPVIPSSWHDGIVLYGRYLFYDSRMDTQKAQYSLASWNAWVISKPDEISEENVFTEGGISVPSLEN